jgi:hypothetical protein
MVFNETRWTAPRIAYLWQFVRSFKCTRIICVLPSTQDKQRLAGSKSCVNTCYDYTTIVRTTMCCTNNNNNNNTNNNYKTVTVLARQKPPWGITLGEKYNLAH